MKYSTPKTNKRRFENASHTKIKCLIWELYGLVCTYDTCVTNNLQFVSRQLFLKVQTWMCLFGWTRHQSNSLVWRRYCGALQLQVIEYVVFLLFHSSAWGVGAGGDNFRPHVRRAIVSGRAYDVIRPLYVWGLWTKTFKEKCYSLKKCFRQEPE